MLASAVAAAACAAALAAPAGADHIDDISEVEPSCALLERGAPGPEGNVLQVNLGTYADLELERVDDRIRLNEIGSGFHREVRCDGGRATVYNIDTVEIVELAELSEGDIIFFSGDFSIDMQDGLLAPGATPEADGSEIEITMAGRGLSFFNLNLLLTPAEDQVRVVSNPKATLINLNAGEATQDLDIEMPLAPFGVIYADAGDDVIIAKSKFKNQRFALGPGVLGEGGDDRIKASQAGGGRGNDRLVGGRHRDFLIGGTGHDVLRGKNERDALISAGGRDLVLGGGGADLLFTADGNGDKAHCGDGRDVAYIDRKDKRRGCERLRKLRKGSGLVGDEALLPFKSRLRTRSGQPIP